MDILIGVLILVVGASVATMGLRIWFWMLPILGFMVGLFFGAIPITNLSANDIRSTRVGWTIAAAVGIALQPRSSAVIALPSDRFVPAKSAVRYQSDREQRAT